MGLMVGFELVKDRSTKEPFPTDAKVSRRLTQECMKRGAIIYPGTGTADGIVGDHILLTPPYTVTREHVDELTSILDESLTVVEKQLLG
jgi:adenosylmethionine-8-amino-7-oxononanoate aminotransferase